MEFESKILIFICVHETDFQSGQLVSEHIVNKRIAMKHLLFLFFLPVLGNAQKNYPQLLDRYMKAQATVKSFSGSVLVMKHNQIML